jgi:hypothetical protein
MVENARQTRRAIDTMLLSSPIGRLGALIQIKRLRRFEDNYELATIDERRARH